MGEVTILLTKIYKKEEAIMLNKIKYVLFTLATVAMVLGTVGCFFET